MHQTRKYPELPPPFTNHPENAVGILNVEQANFLIERGYLTEDGARFILPVRCWEFIKGGQP